MKNAEDGASCSSRQTVLECPLCYSHRAEIVRIKGSVKATCLDCDQIYPIRVRRIDSLRQQNQDAAIKDLEQEQPRSHKPKTKADYRSEIIPVRPPKSTFASTVIEQAIEAGPAGIRKAQRLAVKFAKRYHEETAEHFRKVTKYLRAWLDNGDTDNRARARFALVWRPRFLSVLSMTNSVTLASRHSRISRQAVYEHRKADPEFAEQWDEAQEHAIDMLHARVFQRTLEGDIEPVFYMGVPVAYIRKFDSKLQIEMLRAYRPDRFKTAGVQVNIGTKGDIFVLTEEQRHELQHINREWLESTPPPAGDAPRKSLSPNGHTV